MATPKLKYSIDTSGDYLRVMINGLVHVCVKQDDMVGFRSWVERKGWYCIEFYTKHQVIKTEYDSFDKWSSILKLLNETL